MDTTDNILGGCKIYILNHPTNGEYKYNVIFTDGRKLKTNNFINFINYIFLTLGENNAFKSKTSVWIFKYRKILI